MKAIYWRVIPLIIFSLLIGLFWRGLFLDPQNLPSAQIGKSLPPFTLPQLGKDQAQFSTSMVKGQASLLNVWASWCAACAEEQPFLLHLARDGIAINSLNYKDNPDDALHWLAEWGNPYTLVGADSDGKVAMSLGVYGTPETFLIDKTGKILYRHAGIMNDTVWKQAFLPRLQQLEQRHE